jgi:hypothetical protein
MNFSRLKPYFYLWWRQSGAHIFCCIVHVIPRLINAVEWAPPQTSWGLPVQHCCCLKHTSVVIWFIHLCNRYTQLGYLIQRGRYTRQRKVPQTSLLPCTISPWHHVLSSNNNQAMITLTGITNEAFDYLLSSLPLCMMNTLHLWMKMGSL